jgi:hypothetical protein
MLSLPVLPPQKLQFGIDIGLAIDNMYRIVVYDHIQHIVISTK